MRSRRCAIPYVTGCVVLLLLVCAQVHAAALEDLIFVEGAYENPACLGTPSQPVCIRRDVCALFSGNEGPMQAVGWNPATQEIPPNTPNDGSHYLLQSSIGWPIPATVGWVNPVAGTGEPRNAYEYYVKEGNTYNQTVESVFDSYYKTENQDPEKVYLAFDFDPDTGECLPGNAGLTDLLQQAYDAQSRFYTAYRISPTMNDYSQSGLLDVYFYRSVALIMRGNLELEKAFSVRFLEGVRRPGSEEIHDELYYLGWNVAEDRLSETHGAWHYFNEASKIWIDVFASPIQRAMLVRWAPSRSLVQDGAAFPSPVTVYDGYKDVAVMMRGLSQRARVTNEIARRLVLLLERDFAADIIEEAIPALSLEESVIYSILFPNGLPALHAENYPGLAESFLTYRDSMEEMFQTRNAALNSRFNALGFDRDLLVLVPGSNSGGNTFTYDWLRSKLLGPNSQPLGVLATAQNSDQVALDTRKAFDLKAAEYLMQFDRIEDEYDQQLIDLCGPDPHDTSRPNLTDPEHGGGLLQQQYRNVEMACNKIESVRVNMANIYTMVDIERERVWKIKGINDRKAKMIIDYGDWQADLTEEISNIQADMTLANGLASAAQTASQLSLANPGAAFGAYVQTANAFFQFDSQKRIGMKQAKMARLQAEQQADFVYLENEIMDVNSEAEIKKLFLNLRGLEIEMHDAEIELEQAVSQLSQYYTQIMGKVMRRDRALHRLTRRSFADPTYRIEVLNSALKAEDNFQLAQKWVYLTAKALEYKWPVGPESSYLTGVLIPSVIRARTSENITDQMEDLEWIDTNYSASYGTQLFYWNYSLRKDYLGMRFDKEIPGSGGQILTPVQQFQQYLLSLKNKVENLVDLNEDGAPDHLAVPFSTVCFAIQDDDSGARTLPDSNGHSQSVDGRPIFDSRLWDDKIDWVQVNIVGNNIYTDPQLMPIELWYGGTGFLRYHEPVEVDGQEIDFRAIPLPHYTLTTTSRGFGWKAHPYLKQAFSAKLVSDPRQVPQETYVNNNFREHPVAATDWKILIPLETNFGNIRDIEIVIVHKARTRL
ncbi:MAG: hypothetical protein V1736_10950 [Pseudomonadota bacterium]